MSAGCCASPTPSCWPTPCSSSARSPLQREHLSRGALRAVRLRTWEHTLARLADGYHRALAGHDDERLSAEASDRAA